jgi:outer membrane lipoprotein-sorting protein
MRLSANNGSSAILAVAIVILSVVGPGASVLFADVAAERGLEIATEADNRDSGWGDLSARMVMTLTNRHGESSGRELSIRSLEVESDGDKLLTIFHTPRDVKGTAFLSFTHVEGADDQWLYLPALKRIKRISSGNKSGPFMGSEFAFEDLASPEIQKYSYKYLGNESVNDLDCVMVERIPTDMRSGYTKQVVWYDIDEYRIQRIDFYDRKDSHLKTLVYNSYKLYLDKFWRAEIMEMTNHQTGKATTLVWADYSFGNGFTERDFDKSTLKRVR